MANAAMGRMGHSEGSRGFMPEDLEALGDNEALEDLEASLEGGEDYSEGDEAAGGDEGYGDEGFSEGDEAFAGERDDEGLDEVDEGLDEGEPEGDEAITTAQLMAERRQNDTRLHADARMRAGQFLDRSASRLASDVQRKLDQQLRGIPVPAPVRLERVSMLRGSGVFTARLPNGRTTSMQLIPAAATQSDVNRLSGQIGVNDARQAKALRIQAITLTRLKAAQASANKLHKAELLKISRDLNKRITEGDTGIDKRIAKEVDTQRRTANKRELQMMRQMSERQRRATWNTVLVASSLPLWAAYGDRAFGDNANLITRKNLMLAGSLATYLYLDDLAYKIAPRLAKLWSIGAPFANAATVWLLMRNEQHERFVTGITPISGPTPVLVPLKPLIGSAYFKRFEGLASVNVVASLQSTNKGPAAGDVAPNAVLASVTGGELKLELKNGANVHGAVVEWVVDVLDPKDQRSTPPKA